MNLRKSALGVAVSLAMVLICYEAYEQHLSIGVKQSLIAAVDLNSTIEQNEDFLHDALVQIRTQKDAEVAGKVQEALQIWHDEARIEEELEFNERRSREDPVKRMALETERTRYIPQTAKAERLYLDVRAELGLQDR